MLRNVLALCLASCSAFDPESAAVASATGVGESGRRGPAGPSAGKPVVTVWITERADASLVEPVVATLMAGFRGAPNRKAFALNRVTGGPDRFNSLVSTAKRGDVLVWVDNNEGARYDLRPLRSRGVHVVWYQTKPTEDGSCAVTKDEVEEIWDYSWKNIDDCRNAPPRELSSFGDSDAPETRYVPVGAVPDAPRLPARQELSKGPAALGLMHGGRTTALAALRAQLSGGVSRVDSVGGLELSSRKAFQKYLEEKSQLGIFATLLPEAAGPRPTTWNNSRLLNARGLVLSEPSYWKDEREYVGMVDFVPLAQMGTAFETLAASAAEEREQLRDERHELFARRFDPSAIFERAGIHAWLQQRYAAHALHALQQPCTPGITNMTITGAAAGSDELTVLARACFVEEGAVLLLNAHYENEEVLIVENVQPTHWWEKLIAGEGVASAAHVQLRSTLRYSHANGELLTSFGQAFPKAPVHNFNEEDERKAACEHATKPLHTEEAPFTLPLEMRSR